MMVWLDPLPWLIVLPLTWAALAFVLGSGRGGRLAVTGLVVQLALTLALAGQVLENGSRTHAVGGWGAPLGIDLLADGLAVAMLLLAQVVALPLAVYARAYFSEVAQTAFWPLAGFLIAALNALFLSADLFNLYVTLELLSLAAVGLVALGGKPLQVAAALRYLLVSLTASAAYLMGVALIYGTYGTVSIATLTPLIGSDPPQAAWLAAGLMLVGLLAKTALFPFHFWLPPAHGGATAPVSALLSALVVKASFYLVLRLTLGPSLTGGVWFLYVMGYNLSIATGVGFIALAGVSAEFGVIMLLYLKNAWSARLDAGESGEAALLDAIREGAVQRVRPKAMTVAVIVAGLLPILLGSGTGSEIMSRIAAPMVGGMITAPLLSLFVVPAVYRLLRGRQARGKRGG